MKKFIPSLLLLLPLASMAQNKARSATVTFSDGTKKEFVVKDRQAMLNPHRFTLNDVVTGKDLSITPLDAKTISITGGDTWTGAILDVDQTPVELTDEQQSGAMRGYNPRKDTVFLLHEFNGSVVNLYSLQDRQRTHLFLVKQGGPFEELIYRHYVLDDNGRQLEREDKRYQAQVAEAVKECPLVADATESLRFSGPAISELFKTYEKDCLKSEKVESRFDRVKGRLGVSPMLGYTLNRPTFSSTNTNDLIPPGEVIVAGTPSFGISFVYTLPVLKKRLAAGADLYFNMYKGHADTVRLKGGSPTFYTTKGLDYKISTIRTNFYMQYYLTTSSLVRPFIKAGFGFGYSPSHTASSKEYEFFADALHEVSKNDPFVAQGFKTTQFGFTVGLGIEVSLFAIQYKFETYSGYINTFATTSSLAAHSVFVGFRL